MLDIALLRKDIAAVAARLKTRPFDLDIEAFNALESERRSVQMRTEELQAKRNALSKQVGLLKGKGEDASAVLAEVAAIPEQVKALEGQLSNIQLRLQTYMLNIPNVPHESVPAGRSADDNVEVRRWGTPRAFDFEVRDHVDVGAALGLDFETAAKIAGSRFALMRGSVARLHRHSRRSCSTCRPSSMGTPSATRRTSSMRTACSARPSCRSSATTCSG